MDVHEYLGVLRRGVVFIVLGVLVGLLVGAAAMPKGGPSYAATARDLVTNRTSGDLTEWLEAGTLTEARIASYVVVASSGLVLQPVIDELGLESTVEELSRQLTVTAPPGTFVIEITATAPTPELARDIANAVSAEFGDVVATRIETTEGDPGEVIAPVRIVNIEKAALPTDALPSNGGLLLALGGVLGLALGLGAATLRGTVGTRVKGPQSVARQEVPEREMEAVPAEPLALTPGPAAVTPAVKPPVRAAVVTSTPLPTPTAEEQRAGGIVPELEQSKPDVVERPIVIRPDPPKPSSRFAPDPSKFIPALRPAYASAPAPTAGSEGQVPEPTGTVVDTVSVRIKREPREAPATSPPIRRILPSPGPAPESVADPSPSRKPKPSPEPVPAGSLLGEIGGLPRVEVRAARPVTEAEPDPERQARESYELRARELERVAHDRLMREQQRLAVNIREQLAHDKRELESVLENRLEDTVIRPIELPPRRAADTRLTDPADDDGQTR